MTARTLQPEDLISHYRIVGPLGAGGMGEVYLAQDQTLERSVALKILPPELVKSEERVRRFVREAKSASSLNHPNIVTIYEIGQDEVRGHEGATPKDASSSAVHYISMELVSGQTLTTKIHHDKTDLRTLLGYLAQAAEGLAKAHAAGIVHRDLKPSNIMVSKDGYAKILDFGLAKLTEKQSSDADVTSSVTRAEDGTGVGTIVGTVAYMSPEQVRGDTVDHRSDIFSFGSILYEATTRKKPFVAGSNVETMHKILHDKPAPIEELNKGAPAELRRLIRRCLAKNPDQRLQSAKDVAIELREMADEFDSLSASGTSGSGSSAIGMAASSRRRYSPAALIAGGLIVAAAMIGGALMMRRGADTGGRPAAPLRISAIAGRGMVASAALSADGRYLAYSAYSKMLGSSPTIAGPLSGPGSLWVRQVSTGSDVQILPIQKNVPYGLRFTPDGDYLYYLSDDPDKEGYKALFAIPTLGGPPRKRAYDIDSRVSFSPDGKRVCFYRGVPQKRQDVLVILDLESGKERILASVSPPVSVGLPEWSPDGKRIAAIETQGGATKGAFVVTFRIDDGRRERVGKEALILANGLSWLPDGSGLVVCAFDRSTLTTGQLWAVTYPGGRVHRITSDASFYSNPTLSADGSTIAAVRARREANLWVAAPRAARNVRQITFGSGEEGSPESIDAGQDSTIIFSMSKDGSAQVWTIGANGSGLRPVTSGADPSFRSQFRPGAGVFFNRADQGLTLHIWRSDADGENLRQVTSGIGEALVDVSPDGRTVLFNRDDDPNVLWSVSTDGGAPVRLSRSVRTAGLFSPDGTKILHALIHEVNAQGVFTPEVISAKGGEPALTPAFPPRITDFAWTPDSKGFTYLHGSNGQRNLFRVPLTGGSSEITRFTDGHITLHRWSPDGKRLLLRRRTENADNLWVTGADGSNPAAITDFVTGDIADMKWTRDGSRVVFTYGESSQNVVLIKNFK